MKYIVTINNKSYEVEVEKGQASILKTTETVTPVITYPQASAPIVQPAPAQIQAPAPSEIVNNGEPVKAPMPGTIISVKVTSGTKVKKGDTLFVLEAMKMENEIAAPVDGVIIQIIAAKGSSVSTGDILAVIQV